MYSDSYKLAVQYLSASQTHESPLVFTIYFPYKYHTSIQIQYTFKKMPSPTTFIICFLIILSSQHIESAGRGHAHVKVINTMLVEPRDQDFVTRKGVVFHGKEVSACMPKGRRHSSAPSRYANNQQLFHSLGCSSVARP